MATIAPLRPRDPQPAGIPDRAWDGVAAILLAEGLTPEAVLAQDPVLAPAARAMAGQLAAVP